MFLKRIEMHGFKSFADKVTINFDHPVTGVVGPNGCGKSNITDAIRWVLGEQSVKSMRSSTMTDVIFTGSAQRRMVNMAEVTLVFDNSSRSLASDYHEVEITRRIHRSRHEGEYYINKVPCRLKDILDLVTDSGLGRDSLSMISQGSISQFAEAKPADRRLIFEEAAGVAKYKKRKLESLSKLERTQENMDRVSDIISELERQVLPLKKAAKKAEIYTEKKNELQQIETAVLINDIDRLDQEIDSANKTLFDLQSRSVMAETTIQVHETANQENRQLTHDLDRQINALQDEMLKTVSEIQTLETRKIELDEKRKYTLEVANAEEKAVELKALLEEANAEFKDRANRLRQYQADIDLFTQQSIEINRQLVDLQYDVDETQSRLRRLNSRKDVLQNMLQRPFMLQAGVSAVLDAKNSLPGIEDVVAKIIKPMQGYQEAVSVALGGAQFDIVCSDDVSARRAISFLKKNQSGRATFIPLSVLQPRSLNRDIRIICENTAGFLGVASEFVTCEEKFQLVSDAFLGNVIISDTLENGNQIASLIRYQTKIVTLEGDVIHRGGTMTGGRGKDHVSLLTVSKEMDEVQISIDNTLAQLNQKEGSLQKSRNRKNEIDQQLMERRISAAQIEPVLEAKRAKYERLKNDLETLTPYMESGEVSFADNLIDMLNNAYSRRDEITTSIRLKRDQRLKLGSEIERKEQQIRQMRRDLNAIVIREREVGIDRAKMETKVESYLQRLASEYQMTYDYAKSIRGDFIVENANEKVKELRSQIEALGNINMNAPDEFAEVNQRYEFLNEQLHQLQASRDQLLKIIEDMDKVMIDQFSAMFARINHELTDVFHALFGGGKCRLVLEDPNDLLNTGVDIDVQPPGKNIQNIRLFSGGEKALIAISVLFAILKARHVPLCIFDEIEAALDPGNVERFARYLKKFSLITQFIVVTHRPGTMAQCDILYGVTMPHHGVSQMLKVRLADAVELAESEEEHGIS